MFLYFVRFFNQLKLLKSLCQLNFYIFILPYFFIYFAYQINTSLRYFYSTKKFCIWFCSVLFSLLLNFRKNLVHVSAASSFYHLFACVCFCCWLLYYYCWLCCCLFKCDASSFCTVFVEQPPHSYIRFFTLR